MSGDDDIDAELKALRAEQKALDLRLAALEKRLGKPARAADKAAAPKSQLPAGLEQMIGLQGFSWLGIFALVTGLGLFIRYAFVEGWLGPLAILFGGAAVGAGMIGAGEWVARKPAYRTWAHALMGGGIAVLYFLVYAGYHFEYFRAVTHLSPLTDALLLMAVVGLAIFLALRRGSQSLASRAFVLGFATSLLSHELVMLTLVYNLLLSIGLVGVCAICRWQGLGLVGIVGSYLLHGIWLQANPKAGLLGQGVLLAYFALYSLVGVRVQEDAAEPLETPERRFFKGGGFDFLRSAAALGAANLAGYALPALLIQERIGAWAALGACVLWLGIGLGQQARLLKPGLSPAWQTLFFAHWTLAVILGDTALAQLGEATHARGALLALWGAGAAAWARLALLRGAELLRAQSHWLAAGCLAGLMALEAPTHSLGLLWAAEAAAILWLGQKRIYLLPAGLMLVLATVVQLAWQEFPSTYQQTQLPILLMHGAAVGILMLVAAQARDLEPRLAHGLNWPAGLALMLWLAWALPANWQSMGWTLAGCGLVLTGFVYKHRLLRLQGLALLLLTGAKVFLLDLRELAMGWKILSLLVLGALLLGIALVYTRRQQQAKDEAALEPAVSEPPASGSAS